MHDWPPIEEGVLLELDALKQSEAWQAIIDRIEVLRDVHGPAPDLLFRSGFASARLGDFLRAQRLMADALLYEFRPEWLPWLAAVYGNINWALPMWAIAQWLWVHEPTVDGVSALHARALRKISHELEIRGLPVPPASPPIVNEAMAHKHNVAMVERLNAGDGLGAIAIGEGARLYYPNYQPLLVNLSIAYKRLNRSEESARVCLYAYAIDPLGGGVISNFGSTLLAASASHDAARLLEAGAILFREDASIWCNLAVSYNNMHVAPWEAEHAARRAIALDEKLAAAWSALAGALCRQGRMDKSLQAAKIVGELDPLRKNESLFNLNYSNELTAEEISAAHMEAAEVRFGHHYQDQTFQNDLIAKRRLRVGFVSGDLVAHPVSYFMEPVFEHLPKFCDVFLYHNRPENGEDEVSDTIKGYGVKWSNVALLSDADLHALILKDQVDILVDLSGHTAFNRLPVFAMRAAPIQAEYMGYPNTTGIKTMDYYLCHQSAVSDSMPDLYCEKLYKFSRTSAVYRPLIKDKALINGERYRVANTPALKNGYITFGTLNNISKVSDEVISVWAQVLQEVDGSKIFIESPGLHQREFVRDFRRRFEQFGIPAHRVILQNRDTKLQYVRWNEIDIALDPFPYGGGTTTCDGLWMGVPLVSLFGETLMSRAGRSALTILGRPEWACASAIEYVQCAVGLASDAMKLNEIRLGLRGEMERSPLMNYEGFTGDLAGAFGEMWASYVKHNGDAN